MKRKQENKLCNLFYYSISNLLHQVLNMISHKHNKKYKIILYTYITHGNKKFPVLFNVLCTYALKVIIWRYWQIQLKEFFRKIKIKNDNFILIWLQLKGSKGFVLSFTFTWLIFRFRRLIIITVWGLISLRKYNICLIYYTIYLQLYQLKHIYLFVIL